MRTTFYYIESLSTIEVLSENHLSQPMIAERIVSQIKAHGPNWQHEMEAFLRAKFLLEETQPRMFRKMLTVACWFFESRKIQALLFELFRIHAAKHSPEFESIAQELEKFGDQQDVSDLFANHFDQAKSYGELLPFFAVLASRIEEPLIGARFEWLYQHSEFEVRRELISSLQHAKQAQQSEHLLQLALQDNDEQVRDAALNAYLCWDPRRNLVGLVQLLDKHCTALVHQQPSASPQPCVQLLFTLGAVLLSSDAWLKLLRCLVLHQHHDLKEAVSELKAELKIVSAISPPTRLQQLCDWFNQKMRPPLNAAQRYQLQAHADELGEAAMRIVGNLLPDPRALQLIEVAVQHNDGARINTEVYLDAFRGRSTDPVVRTWLVQACQMNSSLGLIVAAISLSESLDTTTLNPVVDVACRFQDYKYQDDIAQAVINNCDEKIKEMLGNILSNENESSRRTHFAIKVLIALDQPQLVFS